MTSHKSVISQPINIVWMVIGIVILVSVLVSLLPTLNDSFNTLQTNATQINNPIVKSVAPAIPFMVGVGLLVLILLPVMVILKKVKL